VHDATVVGIQGEGLHGPTGGSDDSCQLADFLDEGVVAHGAVVLDIDDDPRAGWGLRSEDAVDEVLKVFHHLLAAPDESLGFVGEDLEDGNTFVLLQLDGRNEAEIPENGVENFGW
jgi:hypothetical protein